MSIIDAKVKFKKIFANLPSNIRNEDIIVVVDDKPHTWNSAYFEIKNDTLEGKKILDKLVKMGIL